MIELLEVAKSYAGKPALAPMSLHVARQSTVVLAGTSGSGKSTLLRLMNGLIAPDHGRVVVDGTALTPASVQAVRRRMGYVIQEGGLFPHLTARDNVTLLARHLGWTRADLARRTAELCELVRLPNALLDRFSLELSGGQRQRVSLMRALFLEPGVLLLDEPLGALDPITRAELQIELRALLKRLCSTVVLVTHDMGEAALFADTVVLMHEGHVVQRGTFEDMLVRPASALVTRFVNAQQQTARALFGAQP